MLGVAIKAKRLLAALRFGLISEACPVGHLPALAGSRPGELASPVLIVEVL